MYTYFLNYMGPINMDWIKKNGSGWRAGRIDVDGPSPDEYAVNVMDADSWVLFGDWLFNLTTETKLEFQELVTRFEAEAGHRIVWHRDGGMERW